MWSVRTPRSTCVSVGAVPVTLGRGHLLAVSGQVEGIDAVAVSRNAVELRVSGSTIALTVSGQKAVGVRSSPSEIWCRLEPKDTRALGHGAQIALSWAAPAATTCK